MTDDFGSALAGLLPRLRAYARALTRSTTIEADDLVHDTLVEALSSEHNFDGQSLDRWVFQIQRRKFYKLVRAAISIPQKQDPRALEEDSLCDTMIAQPSQLDSAYLLEVQAAINALPTAKREVLHLTAVSGMDQREVAEICGRRNPQDAKGGYKGGNSAPGGGR
jgi:RNA polymerase sigma-70 factor, ECF subfamily